MDAWRGPVSYITGTVVVMVLIVFIARDFLAVSSIIP